MSIKQNFKRADHSFEKRFLFVILTVAICILFFFAVDKLFDLIPEVKLLFITYSRYFWFFIIAVFGISLLTLRIYTKTLGDYESQTSKTPKAAITCSILWIFFWIAWSIFCAWITLNFEPLTQLLVIVLFILAVAPGVISFLISRKIRQKDIAEEEFEKRKAGIHYEPYTICLERKYYSGYYGLICLPVFIIALIIGYLIF